MTKRSKTSCLVFMLLASMFVATSFAEDDDVRLTIRQDATISNRLICDVGTARFITPPQWRPNRSDRDTVVILTPANVDPNARDRMISVDIGKPTNNSSAQTATAFAKTWNGRVTRDEVTVDGIAAVRVVVEETHKSLKPTEAIIFHHQDRAYLVISGTKGDASTTDALQAIIDSWKWKLRR